MSRNVLRRFAILASVLLFIQECDLRKLTSHQKEKYRDVLQDLIDLEYDNDVTSFRDQQKKESSKNIHHSANDVHNEEILKQKKKDVSLPKSEKRWVGNALLAVSGVSAAFDIYKQEAGCKLTHPKLFENLETLSELNEQAKQMRDAINIRWNDVVDREGYLTRLDASFVILSQHIATLDSLQQDILLLLDQNVLTKLDYQKRVIENAIIANNDTTLHDPKALESKFYTATQYALVLSLKLGPIAVWIGSKTIFPEIAERISKSFARKWAAENPNALVRLAKNLNQHQLFPNTRARYAEWKKNSPTLKAIKQKLTFSPENKVKLQKAKTVLSHVGQTAILGLFLFYEGWMAYKFFDKCNEDQKLSEEWLTDVRGSITNMTKINSDMTILLDGLYTNYTLMWNNITTREFENFVTEVKETALNAQYKTESLETSAKNLDHYIYSINGTKNSDGTYNYANVETLVNSLNSAFQATNIKLDCFRKKMQIIAKITNDCAAGIGTYKTLWENALSLAGKINECKIEGKEYLSEEEVKDVTIGFMQAKEKNEICVRNDEGTAQLVCIKWMEKKSDVEILSQMNAIIKASGKEMTADDVPFFTSKCKKADVTDTEKGTICYMKSTGKNSAEVLAAYSRHVETQVQSAYDGCDFSDDQKKVICGMKKDGRDVAYCQAKYPLYHSDVMKSVYDACVFEITPGDQYRICLVVKYASKGDINHPEHANDLKLFGKENLQAAINACSRKRDVLEKKALKNVIKDILRNDEKVRHYFSKHILDKKERKHDKSSNEKRRKRKICSLVDAMDTKDPLDTVFTKDFNEIGLQKLAQYIHNCHKFKKM